jgi:hypothetical protein
MGRSLGEQFVKFLRGFLGDRWPWLTKDPVLAAMFIGIIIGGVIVWVIYWLVHRGKIHGRDATIEGLKAENNILEHQKAELEGQRNTAEARLRRKIEELAEKFSNHETEVIRELHGNAIILKYTPVPQSVRLIMMGRTFTEHTDRGMSVRGQKIILEDAPDESPLLDIARDTIPGPGAVVEYRRLLSPEDLNSLLSH